MAVFFYVLIIIIVYRYPVSNLESEECQFYVDYGIQNHMFQEPTVFNDTSFINFKLRFTDLKDILFL